MKGITVMKKLKIFYFTTLLIQVLLALVFFKFTNFISLYSLAPIACIVISLLQAFLATESKPDRVSDSETAYGSNLTLQEQYDLSACQSTSHLVSILIHLPILFFVPLAFKLVSIAVIILTFIVSGFYFRIKHGKHIESRIDKENFELEEQKKKEELGKF